MYTKFGDVEKGSVDYGSTPENNEAEKIPFLNSLQSKFKTTGETGYSDFIKHTQRNVCIIWAILLIAGVSTDYLTTRGFQTYSSSSLVDPFINNHCINQSTPVLNGVDLVAYPGLPPGSIAVYGTAENSYVLNGYTFYFSSFKNKKIFQVSPENYLPQMGGFCADLITESSTDWTWNTVKSNGPSVNPDIWRIYGSKLYIFSSQNAKDKFFGNKDVQGLILEGINDWSSLVQQENIDDIYYNQNGFFYNTRCLEIG
mmetsp:Transcript_15941/g.18803  ORF Transcript_15941/g.18803 Transcript_15941/m.18803 type:complete len:256 (+) Transcript_15941:211-978(+)